MNLSLPYDFRLEPPQEPQQREPEQPETWRAVLDEISMTSLLSRKQDERRFCTTSFPLFTAGCGHPTPAHHCERVEPNAEGRA